MEQLIRTIDEIGKHVRRTEPLDRDMFYEMHYPKWKAETSHTSDIGNITVEAFRTMREQMRKRAGKRAIQRIKEIMDSEPLEEPQ